MMFRRDQYVHRTERAAVALSWTGGKDSVLALHETKAIGVMVNCLVTFAPRQPRFLAHPLAFMRLQSEALGLPHYVLTVEPPFERGYENAISFLKTEHGVGALVTGDISESAGRYVNWMMDRCVRCGVDLFAPLWQRDRLELLHRLLSFRSKAVFSCVKRPWFTEDWLGQELTWAVIERLHELSKETGLDICGENGEYHTLVLDGAQFNKSIKIAAYSKHVRDSIMYISLENYELMEKSAGQS